MKAITHKLKQSLLIWLFVILPLAGLSPALMADDEAAPPEAETTEEPASSDTEEAEEPYDTAKDLAALKADLKVLMKEIWRGFRAK